MNIRYEYMYIFKNSKELETKKNKLVTFKKVD